MSLAEPSDTECTEDGDTHDFIDLKNMLDVAALEPKDLLVYVEKLHCIIQKYDKKFSAYKQKLRHFLDKEKSCYSDKSTQFCNEDWESPPKDASDTTQEASKELSATDAFNFVDEMRQAAKHAENLNNFVFEPTSGMYYDPKTGYYYSAEYGLYYDGNTGCYYTYDEGKNSFEFHSQPQVQANSATAKATDTAASAAEDNIEDIEVQFDEWGGVITDTATLKKIKRDKDKAKRRAEKAKRKAKKKQKKKHKSHKERRRHSKSSKRRDGDGSAKDEDSDVASKPVKRRRRSHDVEDGELSQSSSDDNSSSSDTSSGESEADDSVPIFKASGRFQDIAKRYPPSLRIIVQETNLETLTVGSLHLITYKGGTLGREGAHDVIIPDVNISKCHLKFHYDTDDSVYKCRDLGSRNGTILNGVRMSNSKTEHKAHNLVHGSVIQIAQTKLLCHVHEGNSTCGLCEPGLLIETQTRENSTATAANITVLSHKEQLKKLQKKYGLENEKFVDNMGSGQTPNYNDRAATRRNQVGSSTDNEKTEVASVHTEIRSSNKGFKMLSKLGWQKGETLGKSQANAGLLEPIKVVANEGKTGLGSEQIGIGTGTGSTHQLDKRKLANLKITQDRYQRANDIFVLSDNSD